LKPIHLFLGNFPTTDRKSDPNLLPRTSDFVCDYSDPGKFQHHEKVLAVGGLLSVWEVSRWSG
ncbi:MAG: hypothetical protein ACRD3W_25760, partial [Terriglobales bacterium]